MKDIAWMDRYWKEVLSEYTKAWYKCSVSLGYSLPSFADLQIKYIQWRRLFLFEMFVHFSCIWKGPYLECVHNKKPTQYFGLRLNSMFFIMLTNRSLLFPNIFCTEKAQSKYILRSSIGCSFIDMWTLDIFECSILRDYVHVVVSCLASDLVKR